MSMNRYDQIKAVVADRIPFDYCRVFQISVAGKEYTGVELYDAYANLVYHTFGYKTFERSLSVLDAELNAVYS